MIEHALYFLAISAITGLVSAAIRRETQQEIIKEASQFLVTITLGVGVFCLVVMTLEWVFIRPPI